MSYIPHRIAGSSPPPPLRDQLRLYHVDMNPYGHRVLLILEAKRTKYEVVKLDPLRLPEWFRAANPRRDKFLFESVVICDYLDEKYGRGQLHSRDPYLIKGSLECFDTNFAYGSEQIVQTLDIFEKELTLRGGLG
ncbi:hypothetical protein MSG28_014445 [Choristoneura fumiferana]|uniref:Uncharacterized protein n=2 Tax=Choristoneura fumiferana TaxID=7141 RepID=A0ACC0JRJ8_CHOFU|nr:hypothetical protein MSG28_014445 [Choristoneura fumiferana]KAI8426749.1 hypothetical protein MSG28_014445 [Choristoneura fumiferana]